MMKLVPLSAMVALALANAGCNKSPVSESEPDEAPPKAVSTANTTPAPAAPAANTAPAAPAVANSPAAPATAHAELAPPGVFYTIAPARVETASGIVGLKPGTGVKLTRPGFYLTPYGEVALADEQVTNDMALARQAANQDAAQQAQLKKVLEAKALEAKARAAAAAAKAAQVAQPAPSAPVPEPAALPSTESNTAVNTGGLQGAGAINTTHSSTKGKVYIDNLGQKYWKDTQGRHRYDF
jgi:hypothetical protein